MKYLISLCSILLGLSVLAQDDCGSGTIWDAETSKCVPDPENCGAGTYWNYLESQCLPLDNCPEDLDNDGQVAVTDLLLLLSAYSDFCPCELDSDGDGVCDAEEVLGCTDDGACNYVADATEDDGTCVYPGSNCSVGGANGYYGEYDNDCTCQDLGLLQVTFNVNMETEEVAPSGVYLAGYGIFGNPGDNPMIDDDGDGIYSITVEVEAGFNSYYVFTNGACGDWVCKEWLDGLPCGDPENYNFRFLPQVTTNTVVNTCFGQCSTDGACVIYGCVDSQACNFDEGANADDASCEYPPEFYNCDGVCIADSDGDGICDELEILGCTFDAADNFDPLATEDDGSCEVPGCMISIACNYNPSATYYDGSCFFSCPGCTDSVACNYDPDALQENGSCQYPFDIYDADNLDCDGNCLNDEDGDGVCTEDEVFGCTDAIACNYVLDATEEDESCEYETCAGCMDEIACNYDPAYTIEDEAGCDYESCAGCMYEFACNYDPDASIAADETCEFGTCPGCTDPEACNYNPTLTVDNGSCIYVPEEPLQLGSTIFSDFSFSDFGLGLSVSDDGSFIAIGDPYGDPDTEDDAIPNVAVYELVNGDWTQRGSTLFPVGNNLHTRFGESVAISNDASVLVVGLPDSYYGAFGVCRIYKWNGNDWYNSQSFNSPSNGYYEFGSAVAVSGDGEFIAISAPSSGNCYSGYVKVYQSNGNSYSELGGISNPYYGTCSGPDWGRSISLSNDGSTLAVNSGYNYVHVYDVSEDGLTQKGNVLDGGSSGEVALSGSGDFLIIGTPGADQEGLANSGKAEVFSWENGSWIELGQVILGDQVQEQVGRQVDISNSGTLIAISAKGSLSNETESYVEIFTIEEGTWIPTGPVVNAPSGSSSYYDLNLVLSGDGGVLGVGNHQEAEVLIFDTNPPCIGE